MSKKSAPILKKDSERFSISGTARSYPALPYEKIKEVVVGKKYELSLVFLGESRAGQLNKDTRGKDYIPNVLSFPLSDTVGEIFITPQVAKREASRFGHSYKAHVGYLYIHGLLHLLGHEHGTHMEKLEVRYMKKCGLS